MVLDLVRILYGISFSNITDTTIISPSQSKECYENINLVRIDLNVIKYNTYNLCIINNTYNVDIEKITVVSFDYWCPPDTHIQFLFFSAGNFNNNGVDKFKISKS